MKMSLLLGAALLCAPAALLAQDTPLPPNDMSAQQMPQDPSADPNASMPTGAVPADTGMVPADPNAPSDPSAPVGSPANPAVVGGNVTPPPEPKDNYPMCSRTVQDECMNPGEAGRGKMRRKH